MKHLKYKLASGCAWAAVKLLRMYERLDHSPLCKQAERELRPVGAFNDGLYEGELAPAIMDLLRLFSSQEHSGMSAHMTYDALHDLLRGVPLSPLTGKEDEWSEPFGTSGLRQNLRCSRVFLRSDGTAYDVNIDDKIEFPYTPRVGK